MGLQLGELALGDMIELYRIITCKLRRIRRDI